MDSARLLPPATRALVYVGASVVAATHVVDFRFPRKEGGERVYDVIGSITMDPKCMLHVYRLRRLVARVTLACGACDYSTTMMREARQRKRLDDVERVRRKWSKVMARYCERRASIERGDGGLFIADLLAALDAELVEARAHVCRVYKFDPANWPADV